jgi:SAM-dependent methyltransferase
MALLLPVSLLLCKQIHGGETTSFLLMSCAMNVPTQSDIPPLLRGPVPLSHLLIRQFVRCGDHVIDATCGNGYDTLLLAELIGADGRLWAFDIQQKAMDATSSRLTNAGCSEYAELIHAGHETIALHCNGPVKAVVFNLGYLPGGDRKVITRPDSTLAGLEQSINILASGGIVAITIYPGHEGGCLEQAALEEWMTNLPPDCFHVWRMGQLNVPIEAPYFVLIQKTIR